MRKAGTVSQILSAGVHVVLPDTSMVLTMLFLPTAEASLEWSSIKTSHEIGMCHVQHVIIELSSEDASVKEGGSSAKTTSWPKSAVSYSM
ncbi:hypothetical protein HA466_0014820 [Hirschfeldia incana]|nr:hypothetical protein HA466_0014820 [Hirschfeldia incana]